MSKWKPKVKSAEWSVNDPCKLQIPWNNLSQSLYSAPWEKEKGTSILLTSLLIQEFGFALHKHAIQDALALRYNWQPLQAPSVCACGTKFSIEHSLWWLPFHSTGTWQGSTHRSLQWCLHWAWISTHWWWGVHWHALPHTLRTVQDWILLLMVLGWLIWMYLLWWSSSHLRWNLPLALMGYLPKCSKLVQRPFPNTCCYCLTSPYHPVLYPPTGSSLMLSQHLKQVTQNWQTTTDPSPFSQFHPNFWRGFWRGFFITDSLNIALKTTISIWLQTSQFHPGSPCNGRYWLVTIDNEKTKSVASAMI